MEWYWIVGLYFAIGFALACAAVYGVTRSDPNADLSDWRIAVGIAFWPIAMPLVVGITILDIVRDAAIKHARK